MSLRVDTTAYGGLHPIYVFRFETMKPLRYKCRSLRDSFFVSLGHNVTAADLTAQIVRHDGRTYNSALLY